MLHTLTLAGSAEEAAAATATAAMPPPRAGKDIHPADAPWSPVELKHVLIRQQQQQQQRGDGDLRELSGKQAFLCIPRLSALNTRFNDTDPGDTDWQGVPGGLLQAPARDLIACVWQDRLFEQPGYFAH